MPKRGNLVLAACDACRQRKTRVSSLRSAESICSEVDHVKCDGVRPVCGACTHRDSTCTFQSLPGLSRTATLKSEVAQLRTNNSNLLELYRQLRDGSAVDAWNLVEKIRSGEVPIDDPSSANDGRGSVCMTPPKPYGLVDALDTAISRRSRGVSEPAMPTVRGPSQASHVAKRYAASQRPSTKSKDRDASKGTQHPAVNRRIEKPLPYQLFGQAGLRAAIYAEEDSDASLQFSLRANLEKIQEGFQIQQSCISEVFFCHNKENFDTLVSCLEQNIADLQGSSVLCEVSAVATIAGQYVRDSLQPGVLDQWYSTLEFQTLLNINDSTADMFQTLRASALMTV